MSPDRESLPGRLVSLSTCTPHQSYLLPAEYRFYPGGAVTTAQQEYFDTNAFPYNPAIPPANISFCLVVLFPETHSQNRINKPAFYCFSNSE